jgi:hypothetical protein
MFSVKTYFQVKLACLQQRSSAGASSSSGAHFTRLRAVMLFSKTATICQPGQATTGCRMWVQRTERFLSMTELLSLVLRITHLARKHHTLQDSQLLLALRTKQWCSLLLS